MAPRSGKMSTAGKTKAANNNKKSSEEVEETKVIKKKPVKQVVEPSTRQLRRRPGPYLITTESKKKITTECKKEIPLPITYTKLELQGVMRFLCALGVAPADIERHVKTVYGEATPFGSVYSWCQQFRKNLEAEKKRCELRKINVHEVLGYIKTHRHTTQSEIASQLNIDYIIVSNFLKKELKYRLFLGCWVPMKLSRKNREQRLKFSTVNLARCKSEGLTTFMNRIVVADQTWMYFHTTAPESERPPCSEKDERMRRNKNFQQTRETGPSPGFSLMMTVFWDCAGVLAIDFKEPQEPQTSSSLNFYRYSDRSSLEMLQSQVSRVRPELLEVGLTLLMNEDLPGKKAGETVTSRLTSFGWQGLLNPANSPDLSPSDYHLFPRLKKHLTDKHFVDADTGKRCVLEWLLAQDPNFFATGVQELVTRWERCIKRQGYFGIYFKRLND